jgi:dextranase
MPPGSSDFFNEPSVLLADAVIFATGAAHLELGDANGMLSHEYFPNASLRMSNSLKVALKDYYDFLVAYENLLRDGVTDGHNHVALDGIPTSNDGRAGTVWTLVKNKPGYSIVHLINLENNERELWRDTDGLYPYPDTFTDVAVKIYDIGDLGTEAKLWYASPDDANGKAYELTYTTGTDDQGSFVAFTLPSLQYWAMVWLEQ